MLTVLFERFYSNIAMVYNASWNQGFLVPCNIPPPDFGKVFPFLLLRVGAPEAGVGIDGESFFFVFLPTGEARFLESVDPEELFFSWKNCPI